MTAYQEQPKHPVAGDVEPPKKTTIESEPEVLPSIVERYIGDGEIRMVDADLEGPEKALGMSRDEDNNLLLDREAQNRSEIQQIERFLTAVENGEDLGTFFRREKRQLIYLLAEYLADRKIQLEAGITPDDTQSLNSLSNANFGKAMQEKIKSAAEMIKLQSQKELLRRSIAGQIEYLPFESVKLSSGKEVAFNRANLLDEGSPASDAGSLNWIFSQGSDGELELTISSSDGIAEINGRGDTPDDFIKSSKYVITVEDSNEDELVLKIGRGGAPIDPLFTRIRFVRDGFSINEELRKYNAKKSRAAITATPPSSNSYTPSPPSYQPTASESYRPARNYTSSNG